MFDAGVVKGEVEAAERLVRLVQRGVDLLFQRHIAFHRERAPTGLFHEADRFLEALLRDVGRDHAGARARKGLGCRAANDLFPPLDDLAGRSPARAPERKIRSRIGLGDGPRLERPSAGDPFPRALEACRR